MHVVLLAVFAIPTSRQFVLPTLAGQDRAASIELQATQEDTAHELQTESQSAAVTSILESLEQPTDDAQIADTELPQPSRFDERMTVEAEMTPESAVLPPISEPFERPPTPSLLAHRFDRAAQHVPRSDATLTLVATADSVHVDSVAALEPTQLPVSVHNPKPVYPQEAIQNAWQGKVLLRLHISEQGSVSKVDVVSTSGRKILDRAAVQAVKKWQFRPASQGGLAVAFTLQVPIIFEL